MTQTNLEIAASAIFFSSLLGLHLSGNRVNQELEPHISYNSNSPARGDLRMPEYGIKFALPEHLVEKAASFPESSYGAVTLTLVLKDGTHIQHVVVAGSHVIKAKGTEEEFLLTRLDPMLIVDVLRE